jgi:hypothetical protein
MATGPNITTLSSDEAAMMVASAGVEFGADPNKLYAAFKQDSGGKPVKFQGDPKEVSRKIAAALAGANPAKASPAPTTPAPSTTSSSYRSSEKVVEKGTPEQRGRFEETAATTEQTTLKLLSAFDTASGATQAAIQNYGAAAETSGQANAVLAYTKGNAITEQTRSQEALLTSAGLSAGDPQSLINQRIIEAEGLMGQRKVLADQINANSQMDPLKDPFGWFLGQLKNELLIGQHNSLVSTENAALRDIADRQKLVSNQLSITPAAFSENLRQIQLAQTAAVAMEADTIAKKAKVDANRALMSDLTERMRLSNIPLEIQAQVLKLHMAQNSMGESTSAAVEKKNAEQEELDLINNPRARYGFEPVTLALARMMDPNEKRLWIKMGSNQAVGESPGEQLAAMKFLGISPEQMTKVDQRKAAAMLELQDGAKQWIGGLQAQAADIKDPVKSAAAAAELKTMKGGAETIVKSVDGFLTDQRADFVAGKAQPNNIYKLRIGEAAMKGEFANNRAVEILLTSEVKKSPTFNDADALAVLAGAAKKDLKSIPKLADDMQKLYAKGLFNQFADKGYGTLGIQVPEAYPVIIGGKQINLMDKASIEQYLLIQATSKSWTYGRDLTDVPGGNPFSPVVTETFNKLF